MVVDGVVVVLGVVVVELVLCESSSAATTASATPSPITAATRTAIRAFIPPLIPCRGGSPGGGTFMRLVGSSCTRRTLRERLDDNPERALDVAVVDHQRGQEPQHPLARDVEDEAELERARGDRGRVDALGERRRRPSGPARAPRRSRRSPPAPRGRRPRARTTFASSSGSSITSSAASAAAARRSGRRRRSSRDRRARAPRPAPAP